MAEPSPPPYRREAFVHGVNLAFLAAIGALGFYEHGLWLLALPIEAAILWIVPDLPPFRMMVDRKHRERSHADERAYYLDQLWGLHPVPTLRGLPWVASWFVEPPAPPLDERVIHTGSPEFRAYLEMRAIVERLRQLIGVRGVTLTPVDIARCEDVINGYLRLLIACQPLERAVAGVDPERLGDEIASVDGQLAEATGPLRAALSERRQLLVQRRDRLPRLEATLQLFVARAEAIVQQLRNIHGQVLADPGMNVNEMLDSVMDRQEAIADPLAQASADQLVEEFLRKPGVQRRLEAEPPRAEGSGAPARKRPPRDRERA
ncbi:MAG: hypothetical protein ABMB14_22605 [Myxococcota bacterium]